MMRTRIKDALLTAIEKDETFDFLRKRPEFLETGGKIQRNTTGPKTAWRHSVVQLL